MKYNSRLIVLVVSVLCASSLLAADTGSDANVSGEKAYNYVVQTRTEAGKISTRVKVDDISGQFGQQNDSFMDTVVYMDILKNEELPKSSKAKRVAFAEDNIARYVDYVTKTKRQATEEKKTSSTYHATGFCRFLNDVEVTASNEFANLNCSMLVSDQNGRGAYRDLKLFVGLYPNYRKETLVAVPIYVRLDGKEYPANGVLMNATMTSLSVATYVDNVRIRKLLAKSLLVGSDVAYDQSMRYLAMIEKSRTSNKVVYEQQTNPNGTVTNIPITITNTRPPRKEDYWTVGAIDLAASLVNLFGKDYLEYLTPLFRVDRGSTVWADVVFTDRQRDLGDRYREIANRLIAESQADNARYNSEKVRVDANMRVERKRSSVLESYAAPANVNQTQTTYSNMGVR